MSDDRQGLDKLARLLGGWPKHFRTAEKAHGRSLLRQLRRDRLVDEIVFGLVVRYAYHRAEYDRLTAEIMSARTDEDRSTSGGLTPREQAQFAQFNKLLLIEKQLLGTPYERAGAKRDVQTSFMDQLEGAPKEDGGDGKVMPFQPMARRHV